MHSNCLGWCHIFLIPVGLRKNCWNSRQFSTLSTSSSSPTNQSTSGAGHFGRFTLVAHQLPKKLRQCFSAVKSKNAVGMSTMVPGCGSKMISFFFFTEDTRMYAPNVWKNVGNTNRPNRFMAGSGINVKVNIHYTQSYGFLW